MRITVSGKKIKLTDRQEVQQVRKAAWPWGRIKSYGKCKQEGKTEGWSYSGQY